VLTEYIQHYNHHRPPPVQAAATAAVHHQATCRSNRYRS
jgi:hypothetical protein